VPLIGGSQAVAPSASHNLAIKNEGLIGKFTQVVGDFPFKEPNVRAGHEQEDRRVSSTSEAHAIGAVLCCVPRRV